MREGRDNRQANRDTEAHQSSLGTGINAIVVLRPLGANGVLSLHLIRITAGVLQLYR